MEATGLVLGRSHPELPFGAKGFLEDFLEQQFVSLLQPRDRAWWTRGLTSAVSSSLWV